MKRSISTLLILITCAASHVLVPEQASAQTRIWRAFPASACAREADFPEDYRLDSAGGVSNRSADHGVPRARRLHCPVVSDFTLRQENITAIEVYYDDKNMEAGDGTAVRVYVCNQSLSAPADATPLPSSGSCSTAASSVDGRRVLTAHPDAITQLSSRAGGFFSEVIVEIPKKAAGQESSVLGIAYIYSRTN